MRTYRQLNREIARLRRTNISTLEPEVLEAARQAHDCYDDLTKAEDRRLVLALLVLHADTPTLFPGGEEEHDEWLEGMEGLEDYETLFKAEQQENIQTHRDLRAVQAELRRSQGQADALQSEIDRLNEALDVGAFETTTKLEEDINAAGVAVDTLAKLEASQAEVATLTSELESAKRSNAALKGQITKLKNAGAEADPTPPQEGKSAPPSADEGGNQ